MDFIQFHYDISNEFYSLILDPEMQYSCGYFKTKDTPLAQAQKDKLEHICRKLRLKPGEDFLDIGCGWGGLVCHAAQHYGVKAHGVTLSQTQHDFAVAKVKRLGLEDKVKIELRDYATLDGTYDKISSVGMFEHIGIQNMPHYFGKIHSLLRDRGILMNHGIASRAKADAKAVKRIKPERKLLLKYIFPGSELDSIGNTVNQLQISNFECMTWKACANTTASPARHGTMHWWQTGTKPPASSAKKNTACGCSIWQVSPSASPTAPCTSFR